MLIRPIALSLLSCALCVPAIAAPKPGEMKTFRDWVAGCDNANRCTIASLGPADGELPGVAMALERDAGPAGEMRIRIDPIDDGVAAPGGLLVDGKPFPGSGVIGLAEVAALANSRTIAAVSGGKPIALPASGIAAALRYIDAVQGRAGTAGAIVAKGVKPASAVPAAPVLPVIAAAVTGGRAAMPTAAQVAALARSAKCEAEPDGPQASSFALEPGKALVLVPCGSGAYNLSSAVFVITNGKPQPAKFDAPVGFGEASAVESVVNADYKNGVLTSYAKGRGIGDCGTTQSFVWDGAMFRLSEQTEMGECRGNPNFITTWRARVVRK